MLDEALRYAKAGFPVFPIRARGKIPMTSNGSHDASIDEGVIQSWWKQWPDANVGMTLGGLVVVDIDPRNGGEVDALPKLPETCYAKTGGGGFHYLYKAKSGIRYNAHPSPGIDVKSGAGAYIVVEPSIHESGNRYCWLDESEPWGVQPTQAPEWLGRATANVQPAVNGDIASGGRNDTLTAMAGAMRRRGMSQASIEAALVVENRRCSPPLDDDEVRRISASVARYTPAEEMVADDELPLVVAPNDVMGEVLDVHEKGLGRGDAAGWPSVDQLMSIALGQVTVITGYPNSGKSQWLDALALSLARQGWRIVFCSLENIPVFLHVEKLAKQLVGKPMREGPTERMSAEEAKAAVVQLNTWFRFIRPSDKKPNPSLEDVISIVEADWRINGLQKGDKRACVIDPWNELEHVRPSGQTLTEYIGASLSMLRQWARSHMAHVFIVGHPAKQYRNRETAKLPVATPDMISDSAHFWNKSDICVSVALTDEHRSAEVDIHVQKVRFSHIGHRGMATLIFDKVTGRYSERPIEMAVIDKKSRAAGVDF